MRFARRERIGSRSVAIHAGRTCLGNVVTTGTADDASYEARTPDKSTIGKFKSQTDAARELLAAFLKAEHARHAWTRSGEVCD